MDITLTVVLAALAGLSAVGAVSFSFFFVMATDSCGSHPCNYDALGAAYIVTWGGIGVAILVGAVGIIVAAVRNALMWIWPAGVVAAHRGLHGDRRGPGQLGHAPELMAVAEGFEPPDGFSRLSLSRRVH